MSILEIVLSGAVSLLLTISGFFIVRYFHSQDKKNELFFETFKKFDITVNDLNTTLRVMQEHSNGFEKSCADRHNEISKKLEKIKAA